MNTIIIVAWVDPTGDVKQTEDMTFDGANYFYTLERCPKASALVFSSDDTPEMMARAETFAREKRAEFDTVEVFRLRDTGNALDIARNKIIKAS